MPFPNDIKENLGVADKSWPQVTDFILFDKNLILTLPSIHKCILYLIL